MVIRRRDFVKTALTAGAALKLGMFPGDAFAQNGAPPRALRILVLGGTSFLGPYQIKYALDRGHTISTFNRGRTVPVIHPEIFDRIEHLEGDRDGDLKSLEGRDWDAVIDNSTQRVEWATLSAQLLHGHAKRYLFVSSTGVYYPYTGMDIKEDFPTPLNDDPPKEPPSYSPMKARSELEVRKHFGEEGSIIVRPQYIVGPGDTSDRYPYWPVRFERGGEVLVPGKKNDPAQIIDVRDLAEFMVRLIENNASGTFNAAGPASPLPMERFIASTRSAINPQAKVTWIEDYEFLKEQKLTYAIPWLMAEDDNLGAARINIDRAKAAGLTFRPMATTAKDTLAWWHSDAVKPERREKPRFVLTPEREAEILAAWKAKNGNGPRP
jgi:nucleoside-diphosphate-sugar epimerase